MPTRIESVKVRNFRVLCDVGIENITPLTVPVGPNGSGKSTLLDVFAFLSECFREGLRQAWERRGGGRELKSRGAEGPVRVEIKYREDGELPLATYHLEVDEGPAGPAVVREWLAWEGGEAGKPFRFVDYEKGRGHFVPGKRPAEDGGRTEFPLHSPDTLAANVIGQSADNPRVAALRDFVTGWHFSCLSADSARTHPVAGPQARLSKRGDNLANVIQHLSESHPERLRKIVGKLRYFVPRLENVTVSPSADGRIFLGVKDAPFSAPVQSRFASDGALAMLANLVLLDGPDPSPLIGIEEPENYLHPRLLYELAEEFRGATGETQVLAATHSPYFLDAMRPEEVRVLWRDKDGYARAVHLAGIKMVRDLIEEGAQLGDLWMEDHFEVGNPIVHSGEPSAISRYRD